MRIVVTGGSGFIGSALVAELVRRGHQVTVIDRRLKPVNHGVRHYRADLTDRQLEPGWFAGADAVVHLAGASLFSRWTRRYQRRLEASRIDSAANIANCLLRLPRAQRPYIIIGASAIGYYGDGQERVLTEADPPGGGFLANLCRNWESVWSSYVDDSCRVVTVRTGVVLDGRGGLLSVIKNAYRRGLGPVVGDGRSWLSWISLDDLIAVYVAALETDISGPVNAVAPRPIRQVDFAKQLAGSYGKKPRFILPRWLLRVLLGRAHELVLYSHRVKPTKLLSADFRWVRPTIKDLAD